MKVKRLNEYAVIPTRGSEYAAGYDLYCAMAPEETIMIPPHNTRMIPTGLAMELPKNGFGGIFARSGLASKQGLRPANCVGIVDADYRGEVMVALHNDTDEVQYVRGQSRIAQLVILNYHTQVFEEVNELQNTDRSSGGFGSTGQ